MLTSFTANGYRNVDANVTLGRVNVLIGPNNSGKSNFLRAFGYLSDTLAAAGDLKTVLSKHGGPDVARVGVSDRAMLLHWDLSGRSYTVTGVLPTADRWSGLALGQTVSDRTSKRPISVTTVGPTVGVSGIDVAKGAPEVQQLELDHIAGESLLVHKDRLPRDKWFGQHAAKWWDAVAAALEAFARGCASYRCADFRPADIAGPQPSAVSSGRLGPYGSDLVHALRHLEQSPDGLDAYRDRLAELIPGLKRVYTADSGGTHRWIMLNTDHAWSLSQMSDGTVQAMALAYLLFTPARMSTLCIDEPELNLHPAWLKVIGGWFQRATSCDQVIVSTHSPDLLDTFTEGFRDGDVTVLVFPGGTKPVHRVEPGELDPLLRDGWQLGDLYRAGDPALGGWPW